jgi:hypothetical protein
MCQSFRHMKLRSFFAIPATALFLSIVACGSDQSNIPNANGPALGSEEGEAPWGDELRTKTDAAIKQEIEQAADGANYTSESDYPFKVVNASLNDSQTIITQAIVREKLAWVIDHDPDTDKPLANLNASSSSWREWKENYAEGACQEDEAPGPDDCAKIRKMNDALERNLRGIKVMYFGERGTPGHVDGTAVSVIIVGRTPKGNLVGVRTIAIWT